jgi:hypothetical protein
LQGPWPDLIITSGRRMSAVALWIQEQTQGRTEQGQAKPGQAKIVLIGLPKGATERFSLAVVSEQYRQSKQANMMRIKYPLQRIDEAALATEAEKWRDTFAPLKRPLIAVMVGGSTGTVPFTTGIATKMAVALTELNRREGGTLVVTTSRRTPAAVVDVLERDLPPGTIIHRWMPDSANNPYKALLSLADRFVVTSDSISMLMEIARLGRPLAIYRLPSPRLTAGLLPDWLIDLLRQSLGKAADRLGLGHDRDLTALHRLLVADGLAVWFGRPFHREGRRPADELGHVVDRIVDIMQRR